MRKVGVAARMLRCPAPPRLQVVDLNPHLSCILCGGYFIDATTITECLHSFCRACIVRYLETSQYCPVCEVQVHRSRPLRSDKILQDIVYKLVPGLFHNEMKRRRELYASQPPEALKESRDAEDRGECLDEKFIYASDEIFSLSIEYGREDETCEEEDDNTPKRRFLRCPAAVTISHLKKFIRMKYGIPNTYEVDLRYDKESLLDDYSLMDVAYIFLWQRKGPMRFLYKIVERPPKKLKTEHVLMSDYTNPESVKKDPESDTKEITRIPETTCTPPVQLMTPQSQPLSPKEQDQSSSLQTSTTIMQTSTTIMQTSTTIMQTSATINVPPPVDNQKTCDLSPKPDNNSMKITQPEEKAEAIKSETRETSVSPLVVSIDKKDFKPLAFKFSPGSLGKNSPPSENKPAVMTVAPLTKPSSSLPTTSTTPVTGTITHGLYTGISIKKSPPNTLPPFQISSHLLPPRVPPLKLSPPRFSKLETCLRELTTSKKSSASKKSKSSRGSSDKLELKVAQLKSSMKSVAPLVISVPQETKVEIRKNILQSTPPQQQEKKEDPTPASSKAHEIKELPEPIVKEPLTESKNSLEDDKMDLDSELFEGRLVIAEPDIPFKDDSNSKSVDLPLKNSTKPADSEDEEIDVLNDVDVDSGRGSDISRTEARSLCGDDDLGSPDFSVPKTPEAERHLPITIPSITFMESKQTISKSNGVLSLPPKNALTNGNTDCGVLDLSTCSRKRSHDGDGPLHRVKQVANPAVLDKTRQTSTPCMSPNPTPFKVLTSDIPHVGLYKSKHESSRGNFKCRGNTLTVINPDPNGNRPKIVIRNLGPRPDRGHERFHHHHHNHHHHHQRM